MRIRIRKGSCERFFNLCANHGIRLWDVRPLVSGYEANLPQKDFFQLRPLARKCHTQIRVCQKRGLPFFVNRHRKRKVFALGVLFCGFFIFFLSCFVWRITIEGNQSISTQTLMEYLAAGSVHYGTSKRSVDCRQIAADLRNDFPALTWVSVRLYGTCLLVQLKENTDIAVRGENTEPETAAASDLVSDTDGKIVRMITREGTAAAGVGDEVHAGDVLVKGRMEITGDGGEIVNYRYCAADADIYIQTTLPYEDQFSLAHEQTFYTGRKRYGVYCRLFGKFFGADLGLNGFQNADILAKECQLCLTDGFYLPVSAGLVSAREYRKTVVFYTKEEAEAIARANLEKFLSENEEKGVQIFENDVTISTSATFCQAKGTLTVVKKAGRSVRIEPENFQQGGTDTQEGTNT